MKVSNVLALSVTGFSSFALADFSIYAQGIGGNGISGNAFGYQVYNDGPDTVSCNDVRDWIWRSSKDVSGGKYGVRCTDSNGGDSCSDDKGHGGYAIDEMEFNTRENGGDHSKPHFTYYKNRGGAMVNLSGQTIGHCTPASGEQFFCGKGAGMDIGQRKLDCKSSLNPGNFPQPA